MVNLAHWLKSFLLRLKLSSVRETSGFGKLWGSGNFGVRFFWSEKDISVQVRGLSFFFMGFGSVCGVWLRYKSDSDLLMNSWPFSPVIFEFWFLNVEVFSLNLIRLEFFSILIAYVYDWSCLIFCTDLFGNNFDNQMETNGIDLTLVRERWSFP